VTTGDAITINAGPNDIVNLRGLTIDGAGTLHFGILLNSARSVTITDCFIRHFNSNGIELNNAIGTTLNFLVLNTVSSDNGGSGLSLEGVGPIKGVVDHFTASGQSRGIFINSNIGLVDVTVVDSVMANNDSVGLSSGSFASQASARLTGSVVTGNKVGVLIQNGGTVFSYGDNEINGNGTDVSGGTLTPLAKR
jgi:hypothetical protein